MQGAWISRQAPSTAVACAGTGATESAVAATHPLGLGWFALIVAH